jgi:branched-chain amino acid transport system ATP-binding protein
LAKHLLEVIDLDVFYGDAPAVRGVSFHVDENRVVALVGSNGAGKSTLLKTISGLVRPTRGEILFLGEPFSHLRPEEVAELGLSHVPEGRRLFTRLSVRENLELGAFPPRGRPRLKESIDRAFALFPVLKKRIHQPAGSLSGGEQQMLTIARALMAKPVLLMLDEPSLGLAPVVVRLMFEIIETLHREGVSILLVEQNVHQTLQMADFAYVLQTGKITLRGESTDLLVNPDFQQAYLGMIG